MRHQMDKCINLFSCWSCLIKIANKTYSDANPVTITSSTMRSIRLIPPALPNLKLAVLPPICPVTYDKVIPETMLEMPFPAVISVKYAGIPLISCTVMDDNILPACGSSPLQNIFHLSA